MLGRPRRRGAAPRRIVRWLDRRRAHPRLLRASHSVFTLRAADKVSSRPPPSQSPPQRCTARSFSPRRRSERPTLPRAAIKQARCLPSPHFPSTPTLPLPGTRRCDSRARSPPEPRRPGTARREPAGKELAEPSPASLPAHGRSKGRSPARRLPPLSQPLPALLHEPRAQFRLPPVGRPSRAGGKRRAEPSTTSRRAHGRSKGRGPARRLPPLSQPLPATRSRT